MGIIESLQNFLPAVVLTSRLPALQFLYFVIALLSKFCNGGSSGSIFQFIYMIDNLPLQLTQRILRTKPKITYFVLYSSIYFMLLKIIQD